MQRPGRPTMAMARCLLKNRHAPCVKNSGGHNMALLTLDRRSFLKASAASIVATGSAARIARAAGITLGIFSGGPRDVFGWNKAPGGGAKPLKPLRGIPGEGILGLPRRPGEFDSSRNRRVGRRKRCRV